MKSHARTMYKQHLRSPHHEHANDPRLPPNGAQANIDWVFVCARLLLTPVSPQATKRPTTTSRPSTGPRRRWSVEEAERHDVDFYLFRRQPATDEFPGC